MTHKFVIDAAVEGGGEMVDGCSKDCSCLKECRYIKAMLAEKDKEIGLAYKKAREYENDREYNAGLVYQRDKHITELKDKIKRLRRKSNARLENPKK